MRNGLAAYQENQILMARPEDILIALYDGAILFLKQGKEAMLEKNYAVKGHCFSKAISIVSELAASLKHEHTPELSASLSELYVYVMGRIREGSATLNVEFIDEALQHLEDLRSTWKEAIALQRSTKAVAR